MTKYKIWILDFNGAKSWLMVITGLGIFTTSGQTVNGVQKFVWTGKDIELTTYTDPIQGIYEHNVLPPGFGHVSYIGIEGSEEKVRLALDLIKRYTKIVPE